MEAQAPVSVDQLTRPALRATREDLRWWDPSPLCERRVPLSQRGSPWPSLRRPGAAQSADPRGLRPVQTVRVSRLGTLADCARGDSQEWCSLSGREFDTQSRDDRNWRPVRTMRREQTGTASCPPECPIASGAGGCRLARSIGVRSVARRPSGDRASTASQHPGKPPRLGPRACIGRWQIPPLQEGSGLVAPLCPPAEEAAETCPCCQPARSTSGGTCLPNAVPRETTSEGPCVTA